MAGQTSSSCVLTLGEPSLWKTAGRQISKQISKTDIKKQISKSRYQKADIKKQISKYKHCKQMFQDDVVPADQKVLSPG